MTMKANQLLAELGGMTKDRNVTYEAFGAMR